ncbi:hypothetical protein HanXRQr2_Chr01g0012461 [Helianthus annuus]|uniref:Uncharacterized protein n=1 Tax=Helianthus annuus TaxID=4232 RepID=A0A9K3JU72_HELAN|nr:hypothetical protein HanXRQr2_Chr01g0012461 [Helianthus annuus]
MKLVRSDTTYTGECSKKHRLSSWRIVLAALFRERMIHAVFILTCWVLWEARSTKVFKGVVHLVFKMVEEIKEVSRECLKYRITAGAS